MTTVRIEASRAYDVTIAPGLLGRAGALLRPLTQAKRAALVCGDRVEPLYAGTLQGALEQSGFAVSLKVIPHGEAYKTLETCGEILAFLSRNAFTRGDLVVALGGGVTGDLAGFAAAVYQRGCGLVQVPTTLLAAVDASVGGKTAVDLPEGKNQIGCFCQPLAVLCDTDAFSTLDARELRCGLAECAKIGLLFDRDFFFALPALARERRYEEIVARCVAYKRDLVEKDEFDRGERRLLNLGHSFGHALEQASRWQIPHGEAVAAGMAMIARAAAARGLCADGERDAILALLAALSLPTETDYSADELLAALEKDKKREGDTLTLVVPRAVGRCELLSVPLAEAAGWLRDGGAR